MRHGSGSGRRGRSALLAWGAVAAFAAAAGSGVFSIRAHAQAPQTPDGDAFEVASVKPNKSGTSEIRFGLLPGGRFTAVNVPARQLIVFAFTPLQPFQIEGGPGWINSDRFDVTAKAAGEVGPVAPGVTGPMQRMMQSLLAERFSLKVHRETREMPTYSLVLARSDGRLGPELRTVSPECAQTIAARGRGPAPGAARGGGPGAPPPFAPPAAGERAPCGMMFNGPGSIAAGGTPVSQLAQLLSGRVGRVVVDKTGLTGLYDINVTFMPERPPNLNGAPPPPGAPPLPGIDPDAPSLFTALQEQLGLKLESQRAPVEMLVIDGIEQPTPD